MQINYSRLSLHWKGISITSQKLNRKHNSLLISIQAYPIRCHRKQEEQTKAKGPALLDPKASSVRSIQDKEAWQKGTISNDEAEDHDNWVKYTIPPITRPHCDRSA